MAHPLSLKTHHFLFRFILCVFLCTLCSCIRVREHLILNKDGSGKLILETRTDPMFSSSMSALMGQQELAYLDYSAIAYPPIREESLRTLFPGGSFKINVKKPEDNETVTGIAAEIEFVNVNDLLASPYGKAKSLEITRDGERLNVRARTGVEPAVVMLTAKGEDHPMGSFPLFSQIVGKKSDMVIDFKLTLPQEVLQGNGRMDNQTVSWTIDSASLKEDEKVREEALKVMQASCSSTGVMFSPKSPPRPALDSFQQLKERKVTDNETPREDQIMSSFKFTPLKLVIHRGFSISGEEDSNTANFSRLTGAIAIPKHLVPQKWGTVEVVEVSDDLGNDLSRSDRKNEEDSEAYAEMEQDPQDPSYERRLVFFSFDSPGTAARKLSGFKGEIELKYSSEAQVIKIDKAIEKESILDTGKASDRKAMFHAAKSRQEKKLHHPALVDAGLDLTLYMAVVNQGLLTIVFGVKEIGETGRSISHIQVFDAQGAPLPMLYYGETSSSYWQVMIPGKAEPPLSLALLITGGNSFTVPVELKDISFSGETK